MWHEIHMNGIAMSNDIWIDLSSQGGVISALHVARTRWLRSCMVGKEVCWIEYSSAPTVDDSPQLMVELEEKTSPSKQLPWNGKHMKHIWKTYEIYDVCHFCCLSYFILVGSWNACNLQSRPEHVVGTLEEFTSFFGIFGAFVETLQGNGRQDDHWPRPSSTMAWLAMENGWWEVWNTPKPSLM